MTFFKLWHVAATTNNCSFGNQGHQQDQHALYMASRMINSVLLQVWHHTHDNHSMVLKSNSERDWRILLLILTLFLMLFKNKTPQKAKQSEITG